MANRKLIVLSVLFCSFFCFQSCDRQYVCDCESSIGEGATTVNGKSKKKAKEACEDLSYKTPTNESVTVGACNLRE